MAPFDGVHWRDCKAWQNDGLPLTTASDEGAKLLDHSISQLWSLYKIDSPDDGLDHNVKRLLTEFPDFAMGQAFGLGCLLASQEKNNRVDNGVKEGIVRLYDTAKKTKLNPREQSHVVAVKHWSDGHLTDASKIYESILLSYPTDPMAIKLAYDVNFLLGNAKGIRDNTIRALPFWNKSMPLYPYMYSYAAFGFEEMGMFPNAECYAKKAIEMNCNDVWGHHTLAHCHEHQGMPKEGYKALATTVSDWQDCGVFANHTFWHWGLFMMEQGQYDKALEHYDSEIIGRVTKGQMMLNVTDTIAYLKRLELLGVDVGDRWDVVNDMVRPHVDDHVYSFNDGHFMIALLNSKDASTIVPKFLASLEAYIKDAIKDPKNVNAAVSKELAVPLCKAMGAFHEGNYDEVVQIMFPMRHRMNNHGGSNAQRDVYELMLLQACLLSKSEENHKLLRALLYERKALKKDAPIEDRMMAKLLACHDTNGAV